jgi:hypothetical protein
MTHALRIGDSRVPLVEGFPAPGRSVRLAYRELDLAASGAQDRLAPVGEIQVLPRPWDPPTCQAPHLRKELWIWLDAVVTWLNVEYVWDVADTVPGCWPLHPHLVHEIAVLADQRRQAGEALTSDGLEEWHRYSLPAFVERMKARLRSHCEDDHQPWPARGRHHRHEAEPSRRRRTNACQADIDGLDPPDVLTQRPSRFGLVDLHTGEIQDR